MISITNLAMSYGNKLLFTDVNLNLNPGNIYGLVGANGAGKSTFLKLLSNDETPFDGNLNIPKNAKIGSLKQDQFLYENTKIIDTVIVGNKNLSDALKEKEFLLSKEHLTDEEGYKLGELEGIIAENDGYVAEIFAAELLTGLGIKEEMHYEKLSSLSGGYKLRVLLAQSLFDKPDILLLDEPTNHLDIFSIYWLENYLKNKFKGVLVVISHDISFLNNICTHILDVDYGEVRSYTGNYSKFLMQKEEFNNQKLQEINTKMKKISQLERFVERFKAGTRSRQAASKEKQLDKIELPDIDKSSRISPNFIFSQNRNSGKNVLKISNISKSYDDKLILNNVSFSVNRGDKMIIIGPNGIGKSTLLKILNGKINADSGNFEFGHEVAISYFAQDHHEQLSESCSILEWMIKNAPLETENSIRSILGRMLFKSDEVYKNILNLSGGEAARLLLAKIIADKSNLLIFDEPTNHLDIESKESLKNALINYPGTLILVTHDRDFASQIGNRIIAITEKSITDYLGSYDEYLKKFGMDYLSKTIDL